MITLILQSSLCWLLFMVIYHYFLRRETFFRFNRYYLITTLFLGAGIPLVRRYWEAFFPDYMPQVSFIQGSARMFEVSQAVVPADSFQWMYWLEKLYWIGFSISMVLLVRELFFLVKWIYKYPHTYKKQHTLITTDIDHLPFSFLNYVFVSDKSQFINEEMEKVMQHELSHVSGWHTIDILLSRLVAVVAWFSPMVYWYQNTIRNTHEYLADAIVTRSSDTQSYGQLLIENSSRSLYMSLANHFIYSQLKNRINMMIKIPSKPLSAWKYALIIPILLLLGVVFAYKSDSNLNQPLSSNFSSSLSDTIPEAALYILNGEKVTKAEVDNVYPNQITSVSVLKGDSAIKKYGETGKDGVIEIQTRTLYLIDGVESSKEAVDKISPDDIATMDVVKYGKNSEGVVKIRLNSNAKKNSEAENGTASKIFTQVDEMPMFPGCESEADLTARRKCADMKMLQFLYGQMKYPEQAKKAGLEGKVVVSFIVGKEGMINNVKIIKDIGGGAGDEAIRVVNTMNQLPDRWMPGRVDGKNVSVMYTLPFQFKLQNDQKSSEPTLNQSSELLPTKEIFNVVEEAPRFPGCEAESTEDAKIKCATEKMLQYLYTHVKYPLEAKNEGVQGKVVISFIVNEDGSISDAKIVREIGGGCGEEALKVVQSMNLMPEKWIPGKQKGKAVNVQYNLPIAFKLSNGSESNSNSNSSKNTNLNPIQLKAFDNLKISPNPANHRVEIAWPEKGEIHVHIFDMNGRIVHSSDWGDFDGRQFIDVSKLVKGAYIIRAFNSTSSQDQKLLIQ